MNNNSSKKEKGKPNYTACQKFCDRKIDMEENKKACSNFQPQLWRKEVCRECFQTKKAHILEKLRKTKDETDKMIIEDSNQGKVHSPKQLQTLQPSKEREEPEKYVSTQPASSNSNSNEGYSLFDYFLKRGKTSNDAQNESKSKTSQSKAQSNSTDSDFFYDLFSDFIASPKTETSKTVDANNTNNTDESTFDPTWKTPSKAIEKGANVEVSL